MKKLLLGLLLLFSTGLAAQTTDNADQVLTNLIAKAKAEGSTWNEAQWKDAFRQALGALAPMMLEMSELQKKIEAFSELEDEKALERLQTEVEGLQLKYDHIGNLIEEFGDIAESCEIGYRLSHDDDFEKEILKEFGLDEIMNDEGEEEEEEESQEE